MERTGQKWGSRIGKMKLRILTMAKQKSEDVLMAELFRMLKADAQQTQK